MLNVLTRVPRPMVHDPSKSLTMLEAEEYKQVAAALEYSPRGTDRSVDLETWMDRKGGVYDYGEVHRFLVKKCPMKKRWCWKPLRDKDQSLLSGKLRTGPEEHGQMVMQVYRKAVPLVALMLVRDIEQAFPGRFAYLVSDYETRQRKPVDPFLAVIDRTYPAGSISVVLHWDEPGFTPTRRTSG